MAHVELDKAVLKRLVDSADVERGMLRVGDRVAERAAQAAPKRSGEGAASIHAEVANDSDGRHVRVSWSAERFYMLFVEIGTSQMPARPFLRPALDGRYDV